MSLSLLSVFGLLLGLTSFILAIVVLSFGKQKAHRIWALFNICVSIWGLGMFFIGNKNISIHESSLWWKFAHVGGLFIPVLFMHTILELCLMTRKKILLFFYLQAALFTGLILLDQTGWALEYVFDSFYYIRQVGYLYILITIFWFVPMIWGFIILFKTFMKSKGVKRNQFKYLLISMIIGFAGGASHFFPVYGIKIYPFNITIVFYVLIATYAILRYRLMDINLILRKSMVYSLSAGILTSLFVVIIIGMAQFASDAAGKTSLTVTAIAALIIAILFNPLKNKIQSFIDKSFYKRSYDYYPAIRKISRELTSIFDLDDLVKYVGNAIMSAFSLKKIYILNSIPGGGYEIVYSQTHKKDDDEKGEEDPEDGSKEKQIESTSELVVFYRKSDDILVKDELPDLENTLGLEIIEQIKNDLEQFQGEVVVPVFDDKKLILIIILSEKQSGNMFTSEDINFLGIVSNQLAVSVKNAQFYKDKVYSERLASIGMMSATFAHEIRNPLTSLKTFAQLMPEKYNDEEFRVSFSKIVEGEIERIDGLISDLLDFSTERKSSRPNNFDLVSLVDETVDYVKDKLDFEKKNIQIEKNYGKGVIEMSGDASNLKQAFINIITNGCQAMHGEGLLKVNIQPNGQHVEVSITDTGEGIHPDDVSKIFDPFVTTKEMGIGLGLAISKRIVEDHRGSIKVRSSLSKGTTFTISLPVQN